MTTLWNKGTLANAVVDEFTVGNDRVLDLKLARYDALGSKAHIAMLKSIGLLSEEEHAGLDKGLGEILRSIDKGEFRLEDDVEDIHSQIELMLTRELGDIGKKIHSGRSRNDQVLVDLKLFLRDELLSLRYEVLTLFKCFQQLSETYREVLLPGYTHNQIAMPSSFGLWFGAYAESLVNDMYMLSSAYKVVNRNPLGSAAGYGNSFPLDREMTSRLLHFASLDYNSVAAQLSRGKSEKCVASAISSLALTLCRFAADCCMFMCPNFGFISFPDNLTTGSSIMPHKKNPDVWELIRAKCNRVMACETEISMMCSNLPAGYHRDYQLLKDVLFPALELIHSCTEMCNYMLPYMKINTRILENPLYKYLFTVEEVNHRTLEGTPFREAYRSVGIEVNEGRFEYHGGDPAQLNASDLGHTHEGSLGCLCNDKVRELMDKAARW